MFPTACSAECFLEELKTFSYRLTGEPPGLDKLALLGESRGYLSSYEKKFAAWLEKHNIEYKYEWYGFVMETRARSEIYIPDFYLPQYGTFIELKGRWEGKAFTKSTKFNVFCRNTGLEYRVLNGEFLYRYKVIR